MKKLLVLICILITQNLYAQMYKGTVTEATGTKSHLKDSSCYVYVHSSDSNTAVVTMHFGSGSDFFAEMYTMKKKELAIGDKFLGYDYGYLEEYVTKTQSNDGHWVHLKHQKDTILKISADKDKAKFNYWYTEDDGMFFNKAPFFKIECKMNKTNEL